MDRLACTGYVHTGVGWPNSPDERADPARGPRGSIEPCTEPVLDGRDVCARHGCDLHAVSLTEGAVCPNCGTGL